VCEFLSLSKDDVYQLIAEQKLRTGNLTPGVDKSKVLIYRKLVLEYAASLSEDSQC